MLPRRGDRGPIAIECKWKADTFEPRAIEAFRRLHPGGPNYVVATDVDAPYTRSWDGLEVEHVSLEQRLSGAPLG